MSGRTPSETCSEDGLPVEIESRDQGSDAVGVESSPITQQPPLQDRDEAGSSELEIPSPLSSDDGSEDFVNVDTDQLLLHRSSSPPPGDSSTGLVPPPGGEVLASDPMSATASEEAALPFDEPNQREQLACDMQLVHVPRPSRLQNRLSRYARAGGGQAGHDGSQMPPPPLSLFVPSGIAFLDGAWLSDYSGIAYLNGDWVQLSRAPLPLPPSYPPQPPGIWPSGPVQPPPYPQPAPFAPYPSQAPPFAPYPAYPLPPPPRGPPFGHRRVLRSPSHSSDTDSDSAPAGPTARKTHNPFESDNSDDSDDNTSRESRHRRPAGSDKSRSTSRSRSSGSSGSSNRNRSQSPASSDSSPSSTSTDDSYKPFTHIFPKLGNNKRPPPPGGQPSAAAAEWERQKRELGARNRPLDRLMAMEGLEEVKREFLQVKATIDEARRRKGRLRRQDLNLVLMGNAGTGKRTIAALYRDFLNRCGVWPALGEDGSKVPLQQNTGLDLETPRDLEDLDSTLGRYDVDGVFLLIDAVEHTDEDIRAHLLDVLEQHSEKTVAVLTGSVEGVTRLLGSRPHGRWQFWRRLKLPDYDAQQLRRILLGLIRRNALAVDGGDESPSTLIAAQRVARGRDAAGFGNVHDLVLAFQKMLDRQALRLQKERIKEQELGDDKSGDDGERGTQPEADVERAGKKKESSSGGKPEDNDAAAEDPDGIETRSKPFGEGDDNELTEDKGENGDNGSDKSAKANENNNPVEKEVEEEDRKSKKSDQETSARRRPNRRSERRRRRTERMDKATERENDNDGKSKDPRQGILTMEDIIGPEPADIRTQSAAWKELEKMVGLEDVKKAIGELLVRARANYRREIRGQEPLKMSLNRVFLGPPGTGKTTVARLYGQILADIGVLTTQEVVFKTPADFIGQYIGESEMRTSEILNATLGKVLIIDDAHMFYNGSRAGATDESDDFRLGCIDVLISRIHNRPGEDRCVILIGYPDMMEEMFRKVNPGLRRRFPLEEAFRFGDYDDERLNGILRLKMAAEGIRAEQPAMDVAAEVLRRARDRPNFGNGGDVDNLLNQAKARFRERKLRENKERKRKAGDNHGDEEEDTGDAEGDDGLLDENALTEAVILEREDFDPEWNRGVSASEKCRELFQGLIGFEGIIDQFQGFQRTAANMRRNNRDPRESIPFTYVFKGPPGTGKTHTARILGQIFYDMGFLSTSEVIECSASHLIGEYMGQTAPKVIGLFERALGKVLFIDEAYRLGGGGGGGRRVFHRSYEDEAVGELVDCMTKPRYHKKMIVVLAGYDGDMDALMRVNAGLRGRFPTEVAFPAMSARRCREHLFNLLRKEDVEVRDDGDAQPATIEMKEKVLRLFDKLGMTAGWANGRDVKTLASSITERVYRTANEVLEEEEQEKQKEAREEVADVEGSNKKTAEDCDEGVKRARFRISTKELIEFLKDLLRQRIKGGRAM